MSLQCKHKIHTHWFFWFISQRQIQKWLNVWFWLGKDLERGGTWLAMNKTGKISVLLNILQPDKNIKKDKKSRGETDKLIYAWN